MPEFGQHGPTRIKPWETKDGKVIINPDFVSLKDNPDWRPQPYISYLWVLKDEDNIFIGIETQVAQQHTDPNTTASRQGYGHPTLTEGGTALYGGELLHKPELGDWIINGASGRYGRSDVKVVEGTRLRQAKTLFNALIGLGVTISDYEVRNG